MQFSKLTHTGGLEIYINPQQVRAVLSQGERGSRLVFDPAHEINVKEDIARAIEALRHPS
jgi:hypothetical protein